MRLLWDIEANGLRPDTVWCLALIDIDTKEERYFTDHDITKPPLSEGLKYLSGASVHIGHNLIGYDLRVLSDLHGFKIAKDAKIVDTMLLSQLNDFYRPSFTKAAAAVGKGTHAMAMYGVAMGEEKEPDPPWDVYSPEMESRCVSDVKINLGIYNYLMREAKVLIGEEAGYGDAIRLEHDFATICSQQSARGWLFDDVLANSLIPRIDAKMEDLCSTVEPHLKPRKVWIDKDVRKVFYLKDGVTMDRTSRAWFADKPLTTEYRRFKMVDTDMGNNAAVQNLLLENGWKPTEWNWKIDKETGHRKKMSPKLTEDSYPSITGDIGKRISEWRTLRSRRSLLEGLLKLQRGDGRVACDAFTLGTNTHRVRHRGIVNIPSNNALIGERIRQCFTSGGGRVLVSADSDSNQLRGFAHYLNNEEVTEAIVEGSQEEGTDVHTRTANFLEITRPTAKNVTYALLFGAKDKMLADTAGRKGEGPQIRLLMEQAFPGFEGLAESIDEEWTQNSLVHDRGFVIGLDGRRVYCLKKNAFNSKLQAFEAVTCKEAAVEAMKRIRADRLDADLICHYHDEFTLDSEESVAKKVAVHMEYGLGPHVTAKYNLNVRMGGTAAIGNTWAEVH